MARALNYFDNLKDKIVKIQDVADGITEYINGYLNATITETTMPVTNGGVGTVWSGQSTGVSWGGTTYDLITRNINDEVNAFKSAHRDKTITADDLCNLLMKCLWYACRVYFQTYSYYRNVGYTNTRNWPPIDSATYRGLNANTHVSEETYKSENSIHRPTSMREKTRISRQGIDAFLTKLVEYNEKKEYNTDHGCRNTCYGSCHIQCHGSSRGRR